jgi:hypothetical protein
MVHSTKQACADSLVRFSQQQQAESALGKKILILVIGQFLYLLSQLLKVPDSLSLKSRLSQLSQTIFSNLRITFFWRPQQQLKKKTSA